MSGIWRTRSKPSDVDRQRPASVSGPTCRPAVLSLRTPSARQRGRHLALVRFETIGDRGRVLVLRILHEKIDLPRHLAPPA
jgi:plasmid stabilization system protein ParE